MDTENVPEDVEWELSKENVQPLRHGRKVANLTAALQPLAGDQLSKIQEQRRIFEADLRTYKGDDPLDVWYRYIKWTEENYPKGGKDGHMLSLVQKCITTFTQEEKYKNDQRYLEIWINFAGQSKDPVEIFTFLYDNGIGGQLASFYEAWTWQLEQVGNTKKADAIYREGICRGAQPLDRLERSFREFQARTVRHATLSLSEFTVDDTGVEERSAFAQLKGHGKHKVAGTIRTGAARHAGPVRGLGFQAPRQQHQIPGFQVFNDENQTPLSCVPPQTGEWSTVPTREVTDSENDKTPGVWTKAKMGHRTTGVTPSYNSTTFTVHADAEVHPNMRTPMKTPDFGTKPLSAVKPGKETNTLEHLNQMSQQDASSVPMYRKELIYNGLEEYQFEQIRAAEWKAKKRDRDRLEEEKSLQEQRETFRREMQHQMELLSQRELALKKTQEDLIERMRREQLIKEREDILHSFESQNSSTPSSKPYNEAATVSNVTLRRSGLTPVDPPQPPPVTNDNQPPVLRLSSEQTAAKSLSFDDLTAPTNVVEPSTTHSTEASQNNSMQTPNMSGSLQKRTHSGHSSGKLSTPFSSTRIPIVDPSPTINTKEANAAVMGMFTGDFELEQQFGWSIPVDKPQKMDTSLPEIPPVFKIYETPSNQPNALLGATINMGENNENRAPPGYHQSSKRRALGEILQPAMEFQSSAPQESTNQPEEEQMDGIELTGFNPRDDITLAPLGSQLDFAAFARLASTPHNHFSRSSHSEQMTEEKSTEGGDIPNENKSGLSPIMETSEEDLKFKAANSIGASHHANQTNHASHVETTEAPMLRPILLPKDESLSPSQSLTNQSYHVIDTSGYHPQEDKLDLLSTSIAINPRDPFDEIAIQGFLSSLGKPISSYPGYHMVETRMPEIVINNELLLDTDRYIVECKLGEGGFASVYRLQKINVDDLCDQAVGDVCVMKIQRPPCPWEFYTCSTLQKRLSDNNSQNVLNSVMSLDDGYFYEDGSCLLNNYHGYGTLLDLVNLFRRLKSDLGDLEPIATYITIELLHIMEQVHKCEIIHGDIKPDNFLVKAINMCPDSTDPDAIFKEELLMLKLIDFGQSIDMTMYPPGTTFTAKIHTSGFQCIEMKTDKPWTYQTDLFGLIGTLHVVIFGEYMKIYQENGTWKTNSNFPRKWNTTLWKDFFHTLLNIPSCTELPDLTHFRRQFEEHFINNLISRYRSQSKKIYINMPGF